MSGPKITSRVVDGIAVITLADPRAEVGLADGLALERELLQQLFQAEDAGEGIRASLEKRTAVFKGR